MARITTDTSVEDTLRKYGLGSPSEAVDRIFRNSPVGPLSSAIGDSFYGINHQQTPNSIPVNKDYHGLVFFTRPRMNLTTDNIRASRQLAPLLNTEPASIQRIIRTLLSPELQDEVRGRETLSCPFVDPRQAFIPILTNHIVSMSGWPDVTVPKRTIEEGVYKEAFGFVDGLARNYSAYNITANFRNIPGDPITMLFFVWLHYASLVYEGVMVPLPEMIVENEIDYNTRIYRLVLDPTKTKVQKIGACGAGFPENDPMGAAFNFESDRPINASNDQISISFQCFGAQYQDDILVYEFNKTVEIFNQGMEDSSRASTHKLIPLSALGLFNNRGYPRINPQTYALEWWVDMETYSQFTSVR